MQINLPVDSTRPRHRRQLIISRKEDRENTLPSELIPKFSYPIGNLEKRNDKTISQR